MPRIIARWSSSCAWYNHKMNFLIVGLGNPGDDYENTRHNIGRRFVIDLQEHLNFSDWEFDKKTNSILSDGKIGKHKVTLMLPEGFMNNSGKSAAKIITSAKKAENLIVVYDDIDIPIGGMKVSYGRGDGGHNGVASVIKSVKTKNFGRVRIGICPTTPTGKTKKPRGEKSVLDFLMKNSTGKEDDVYKKVSKEFFKLIETYVEEGRAKAANLFN